MGATKSIPKLRVEFAEALKTDLGRLEKVAEGLGRRAADYVVTGTPESVLLEIAANQRAASDAMQAYIFRSGYAPHEEALAARKKVLLSAEEIPFAVIKRLGTLMTAIQPRNQLTAKTAPAAVPAWLFWIVEETNTATGDGDWQKPSAKTMQLWSVPRLEACLADASEPRAALLHLLYGPKHYFWDNVSAAIPGLEDYLKANAELVTEVAGKLDAAGRTRLIEDMARHGLVAGLYLDLVFGLAVSSAKAPAMAARAALRSLPFEVLAAKAKAVFEGKDSGMRRAACEVLAAVGGAVAVPLLEAQLAAEPVKSVREAVAALIPQLNAAAASAAAPEDEAPADVPEGATVLRAIDGSQIVIPPAPPLPPDTPLPRAAMAPLERAVEMYNAAVEISNRQRQTDMAPEHRGFFHRIEPIGPETVEKAFAQMHRLEGVEWWVLLMMMRRWRSEGLDPKLLLAFYEQPEVTLWHIVRQVASTLNRWFSLTFVMQNPNTDPAWEHAIQHMQKPGGDYRTLIEVFSRCKTEGLPGDIVRSTMFSLPGYDGELPPTLQYFVLENLEFFEEAFGVRTKSGSETMGEVPALRLLGKLDKVPERLLPPLLSCALVSRKPVRIAARKLLAKARAIDDAIVARLYDPKREIRAGAAEWLAQRAPAGAADALRQALKKEKAEQPRAAMISALSRLGEDTSPYFDSKALQKEAEAGLAKNTSKSLDWFPWPALPALRWMGGEPIAPDIVKWWLVLADKLKDPGGNALFELYLDRAEPQDAAALGLFVAKAFIDRDTVTCSGAEANAHAEQLVQQQLQWWANHPSGLPPVSRQAPEANSWFQMYKSAKLREHLYSASDNKGLLALAVRAPGPEVAALVRNYIKEHGGKVSQVRSLLTCLASNPAPAAIQVVLGAANRIKQKSVQAYANELIEALAERRGWSADELADRTIPTAGLDEAGTMTLDCGGGRLFSAVYKGDSKLDLVNPQGKTVKSLPAALGEEDKEPLALAKKQLASARKELKLTVTAQSSRLYEAMCTGRTWPLELWTSCLLRHPVAAPLVQQLVWQGLGAENTAAVPFRVLEDGSLTDANDDSVEPAGFAAIRLAHRALMSEEEAEAWATHLADYEVKPLFAQLDRPLHTLSEAQEQATAIEDRKGWMIESLKLKGIATKLGYQTGPVGDGGSYMNYTKNFNGANIVVSAGFTGSYMGAGIERIAAALTELTFLKAGGRGKPLVLGSVPPVLLSEAVADLHAIAAAGTGFDPDWQKKAHF